MEIFLLWNQYPWPFGNFGCALFTLISELVTHVSIITMIAFTIERYVNNTAECCTLFSFYFLSTSRIIHLHVICLVIISQFSY